MSEPVFTFDTTKGTRATLTVRPMKEVIAEERLRDAAPDLLAACKAIDDWKMLRADAIPALRKIITEMVRPAIAKATQGGGPAN